MDLSFFSGHGYLLIGGLLLIGVGLLIVSLVVNSRVAHSVEKDERHREKLFEYYRNTFSQLGVILIGIGVSLFIFFFQQNYQDQRRRDTELQQMLSKISVRLGRAAALTRSLNEFDDILDDGGPYKNPQDGGTNRAVTATGQAFAEQIAAVHDVERDIDIEDFSVMGFSRDLESSTLINELDPRLWYGAVEDESDVAYAVNQLAKDYQDLDAVLDGKPAAEAVADPARAADVKREVLDILYDMALLRDGSRRIVGRFCWLLSNGTGFLQLQPIDQLEQHYPSHQEWIDRAAPILGKFEAGGQNCYEMLRFQPKGG